MRLESFVNRGYLTAPLAFPGEPARLIELDKTQNLLLEQNEPGAPTPFSFYKAPGLKLGRNYGADAIRGMLPLNQLPSATDGVWLVCGDTLYLIDSTFAILDTQAGLLVDSGRAAMAASPAILVVASAGNAYAVGGGPPGLTNLTWFGPGVRIGSVGVCDTFFLFLDEAGDGFYFSEPGDAYTGSPTNFISAEASATKFIQMLVSRGEVWLFGSLATQVFYNNANNNPFVPFAPNLSATIPKGTCAKDSVIDIGGRICWLTQSENENCIAVATNGGYVPQSVSTHVQEYIWSRYDRVNDAVSWSLTIKGHPLWRIWFPTADVTWQYDFSTNDWTTVPYYNIVAGTEEAHLGRVACAAFNSILVGDRKTGNVYKTSLDYQDDNGAVIRWLRRCPTIENENKRITYPWFELSIQAGVGDGSNLDPLLGTVTPEADPQIMMRFSNDWGRTWSNERSRSMGKQGEYSKRVIWKRRGVARKRVFEISGTAKVPTAIHAAYLREPGMRET